MVRINTAPAIVAAALARSLIAVALTALSILSSGCREPQVQDDFVARVGSNLLHQDQLQEVVAGMSSGSDSMAILAQLVDQWIVNELIVQEARRLNLSEEPEVARLLEDNEKSVLVSAFVDRLYEENPVEPTPEEISRFFELNKERLRLREPFVRVRYLSHTSRDTVRSARRDLQRAMRGADTDSLWIEIARRYSQDVEGSVALSANHFPEGRLFGALPEVHAVMGRLGRRELSRVVSEAGRYHIIQLIDRVQVGALPELRWVEEEVVRQLILQGRKQTFARTVQNLRNLATARNDLEIRIPDSVQVR